ncbi:hypothetical protein PT974_00447 [Cladobotryum mycophilum]|uniref:Mannose-1-phosphate guanylyltransferase n=1 Tax=Cladobotryum mycophilum TaxID=491253 RepID=A0ABR0T231_9HYPO
MADRTVYTTCVEYPKRASFLPWGAQIYELQVSRIPETKNPGYQVIRSPTHRIVAYLEASPKKNVSSGKPKEQPTATMNSLLEKDIVTLASDLKSAKGERLSDPVCRKSLDMEIRRYPKLVRSLTRLLHGLEKVLSTDDTTPALVHEIESSEDDISETTDAPKIFLPSAVNPVNIPSVKEPQGMHIGNFAITDNAKVRNGDVVDEGWKGVAQLPQNGRKLVIGAVEAGENCRVMNGTAFISGNDPFWD